jgi:hypothetical protein
MFKELKQTWNELDTTQKIIAVLLLPLVIPIGIIYGLFLIFWNKYGLAFICAVIIAGENDSGEEAWEKGQALALLIGLILLIRRAYKESKKEGKL